MPIGPVVGAAALGAGWGGGLFAVMVLACLAAAGAALRLGRHLPPGANLIPPSATAAPGLAPADPCAEVAAADLIRS